MMTEDMIKKLEEVGFKRWTKGNFDRLYINATTLGLELTYYKTGNISSAKWNDHFVSNCEGRRMVAAKTYVDVKTGKIWGTHDALLTAAQNLVAETVA